MAETLDLRCAIVSRTSFSETSGRLFQACFKRLPEAADIQRQMISRMALTSGSSIERTSQNETPPPIGKRRYHKKWRKGTGFEPSTRFPVCRVSGALSHSATFPRLQNFKDFKTWRPSLDLNQDMKRLPRSRVDFPPPGHESSVHQQLDPRNCRSSRWLMCIGERAIYRIE